MKKISLLILVLLSSALSYAENEILEEPIVVIIEEPEIIIEEETSGDVNLYQFTCTDNVVTAVMTADFEVHLTEEGKDVRKFALMAPPLTFTEAVPHFDSGAGDKTQVDILMAMDIDSYTLNPEAEPVLMQLTKMTSANESSLIVSIDNKLLYLDCE